ncbi:extracellular solute-binding protein [Bradyrhizobium archetypum]|uniref:Extracellular solute-binding protein n=1 Tax=Bradyrhizobium archetypum TaxID=2721160 RepID=A0A7Y4M6A6_9BRAD|nr:extracellular solute-binding protein [Bradyrhizobium archetypum]NOJ50865.1 extracellular solute-binding protein [Bradyrhizobium archetypum]
MKRRDFLKTTAAAFALPLIAAPAVHAQQKRFSGVTLRINGYGGNYDKALIEGVAKPLEEKTGLKVEYFAAPVQGEVVKLISNKGNPHVDLLMVDNNLMPELIAADVLDPIKVSDVPNVSRILPGYREFNDFGAPFAVSSLVPVFNSDNIKPALTGYADIARSDLKGKVAIPGTTITASALVLLALAEANGGSVSNMEPAFKFLAEAKDNVVATPNSTVAQLQLFSQGEAQAGIFWDGRAYELRQSGVPIQTVVPKEGIYAVSSYVNLVKGGRNREAALAYIEQALSDQGQLALPKAFRFGATTNVALGELLPDILLNSPERVAMKRKVDWAALMKQRGELAERMNKVLRG